MNIYKDPLVMRVSPALLACFSLVAISGLPSQAADTTETADLAETSASAVSDAAAPAPAAPSLERLYAAVANNPAPTFSKAKAVQADSAQAESIPAESIQFEIAQAEAVDEAIDDTEDAVDEAASDTDDVLEEAFEEAEEVIETIEEETPINVEPAPTTIEQSPGSLPVPSAPTQSAPPINLPEAPEADVEADEATPAAPNQTTDQPTEDDEVAEEARVLVAEVDVVSLNERRPLTTELIDAVYRAVETVPGRTTTRTQLQEDINSVFSTGFFSNVRATPEDTPLGVKVTFFVEPNPVLNRVDVRGRQVLDDETADSFFNEQYGQVLNLRDLQNSILDLTDWYEDNGYVLAQVADAPQISGNGTVTLIVTEGEIESIEVRYVSPDGELTDEDGNPIGGKTRDFIVTREFETQPGDVFQEEAIRSDLERVYSLGLFEIIPDPLSLEPGDEDPRKVKLVVNIAERDTGSIGASLGFNLRGDLFGQLSYNEDNFGGNNQKLRTEGRVTTRGDFLFDISFTDPWIAGDPYRTSYTTNLFNRRATSLIFDNGPV
ncbi:MAG: POTRA domain-containing protein, partial [Cyanobacteria bacterium J06632_3]